MRYGLDFGTSNSSMSFNDGEEGVMIPLESSGERLTLPSAWFFDDEQKICHIGRSAIRKLGSGTRGRYMQSIKRFIGDKSIEGTNVNGKFMTFKDIIGALISDVKHTADQFVGQDVRSVRIGMPFKFSSSGSNELALERIAGAAHDAGFEEVDFMLEPLAATYALKSSVTSRSKVLTLDIGGGTTDLSVVELYPEGQNEDRVLYSSGVVVGGDDFTSEIMRNKLLHYFGYGSMIKTGPETLIPFPSNLITGITHWYSALRLARDKTFRNSLSSVKHMAVDKEKIEALEAIIYGKQGVKLFEAVEIAKKELSDDPDTAILFSFEQVDIYEILRRTEFEQFISPHVDKINDAILDVKRQTGIDDVDYVMLVGGSSQIPLFRRVLNSHFSSAELVEHNQVTSVAYGLSHAEYQV